MIIYNTKTQFHKELTYRLERHSFSPEFSQHIKKLQDSLGVGAETAERDAFYRLCGAFADISLNAIRLKGSEEAERDTRPEAIDACFRYEDIRAAGEVLRKYMAAYGLSDAAGLLDAVGLMHSYAVSWDDPRRQIDERQFVAVLPEEDCLIGELEDLCEIPQGIWEQVKEQIIEAIK